MNEFQEDDFQIYLEDTDDQITAMSDALRAWEREPSSGACRRASLRLLHAMEGAAGTMGLEAIRDLTLQVNRKIERACSREGQLDPSAIPGLLRGLEFLRTCNDRLRAGEPLPSDSQLKVELTAALGQQVD